MLPLPLPLWERKGGRGKVRRPYTVGHEPEARALPGKGKRQITGHCEGVYDVHRRITPNRKPETLKASAIP